MNADKNLVFNPRSSAFIGGHSSFTRSDGRGSENIGDRSLRRCEKIARKRARGKLKHALPVKMKDLLWWRRRFRLRSWVLSQHLTFAAPMRFQSRER